MGAGLRAGGTIAFTIGLIASAVSIGPGRSAKAETSASAPTIVSTNSPPTAGFSASKLVPTTAASISNAAPDVAAPKPATRVAYVSIPALGLAAVVIDLHIGAEGQLEVPEDVSQAGWFTGGSLPGTNGPAVIVGHRDSYAGPGVFARLELLRPDDVIDVTLDSGVTVRHRVVRIDRVSKDEFPTEQVYGVTAGPELRLITCDGVFDRGAGSYKGNLVVHAVVQTIIA